MQNQLPREIQRAQGMPGAASAPAASRAKSKKHTSVVTTGSPIRSGIPCTVVYDLFHALPGDRAFLSPSPARSSPAGLTSASRRQNHVASPSADRALSSIARTASTASRANVCDDWPNAPHVKRETREEVPVICPSPQVKVPATQWHDGQIRCVVRNRVK